MNPNSNIDYLFRRILSPEIDHKQALKRNQTYSYLVDLEREKARKKITHFRSPTIYDVRVIDL